MVGDRAVTAMRPTMVRADSVSMSPEVNATCKMSISVITLGAVTYADNVEGDDPAMLASPSSRPTW